MSASTNPPRKRRPGRPSKLTPDTQARILSMVRSGASYKTACIAGGIGERTFHRWRSKGEDPHAKPEYRQFWLALTRAEQEGHAARLALITKAARTDWRAAAWMQERLDPQRWSLKHKVEHTVEHQAKIEDGDAFELLRDPELVEFLDRAVARRQERKYGTEPRRLTAGEGA
jgi:hypothetical protein